MARTIKRRKKRKDAIFHEFGSGNITVFRRIVQEKLEEVTQEYGITFIVGKIKYNEKSATVAVEGIVRGGKPKMATDYELQAKIRGLKPLGTEIYVPGVGKGNIIGWKRRARKYPVIVEMKDGSGRYKVPEHYVV